MGTNMLRIALLTWLHVYLNFVVELIKLLLLQARLLFYTLDKRLD